MLRGIILSMVQLASVQREPVSIGYRLQSGFKGIAYSLIAATTVYGAISAFREGRCSLAAGCNGGLKATATYTAGLPAISLAAAAAAKECFQECFRKL